MTKRIFLSLREAIRLMVENPSLVARLPGWDEDYYIYYSVEESILLDQNLDAYIPDVNHILYDEWEITEI